MIIINYCMKNCVDVKNIKSKKVMEKYMTYVTTLKNNVTLSDGLHDMHLYVIKKMDWEIHFYFKSFLLNPTTPNETNPNVSNKQAEVIIKASKGW